MGGNLYEILGVGHDADFEGLKKAYRQRAKACHPDLHGDNPQFEAEFKQLVNAFDVLSDPARRQVYDLHCAASEAWGHSGPQPSDDRQQWRQSGPSVMDNLADDILEELIVGADVPRDSTLQSLMRDLEHTERFLRFREVKNLFHRGRRIRALHLARICIHDCPGNILYQYQLGKIHVALKQYGPARKAWNKCLRLGAARNPPQYLQRVRNALERIRDKGSLWHRLSARFQKPEEKPMICAQVQMIDETTRAMTRLITGDASKRRRRRNDDPPPPKITG